jgi:hypothetical protein
LVEVAARDKYMHYQHSHCNLEKEELLAHKVGAIRIPDTTDSQHWVCNHSFVEGNLHRVHSLEPAVDSSVPEVDIQDRGDKVDMQVEIKALPRDARPGSQTHARDR